MRKIHVLSLYSMDVHRVRFVDVEPKAIHCLAFSSSEERPRLAVSRADASIELWRHCEGRELRHELTIPGRSDSTVEAMVWSGERLFSTGLTGQIYEWDFIQLKPLATVDALGTAVWCMDINKLQSTIAVGCDNGKESSRSPQAPESSDDASSVKHEEQVLLFQITPGSLLFSRSLDKQDCRLLSLSWHPKGQLLAVGGADSTVRVMDTTTGRCNLRITLDEFQERSTLVWDIKFLSDHSIISADSLGKIQVWDSQFGSLKQSLQFHLADVLALANTKDEDVLYASGVDQKIVKFQKVTEKEGTGRGRSKWVKSGDVRVHTHDVRMMAVADNGCLVSGGVDTRLMVYDTENLDSSYTSQYSPFAVLSGHVHVAATSNVLMVQNNTLLKFWHLSPRSQETSNLSQSSSSSREATPMENGFERSPGSSVSTHSLSSLLTSPSSTSSDSHTGKGLPIHFLELNIPGSHHILSSAISPDASMAALCNVQCLWLYQLTSGIVCSGNWQLPAIKLSFNPLGSELAMACLTEGLKVMKIISDEEGAVKFVDVVQHRNKSGPRPITDIQYSPDGSYLAAVTHRHRLQLFNTDSYQLIAKLPSLDDTHLPRFCFDPRNKRIVLYCSQDREMFSYNLKNQELSSIGSLDYVPHKKPRGSLFLAPAHAVVPVPAKPDVFALHDTHNLVFVRCCNNSRTIKVEESPKVGTKRRKGSKHLSTHVVSTYREMLHVSVLDTGALLVVEKPWTEVLNALPPALIRDRYGT